MISKTSRSEIVGIRKSAELPAFYDLRNPPKWLDRVQYLWCYQ